MLNDATTRDWRHKLLIMKAQELGDIVMVKRVSDDLSVIYLLITPVDSGVKFMPASQDSRTQKEGNTIFTDEEEE
jgi:hypothetical protein